MTEETVSDTVAANIRETRKGCGWKPADLAARCAELGAAGITENVIENIESGRRGPGGERRRDVTVDELLALAYALDIAPVHLITGLDDEAQLPVSPERSVSATRARQWIRGLSPVPGVNRHRYELNVPASERDTTWFVVPSDYEGAARALEAAQAFVSLAKWREENEA